MISGDDGIEENKNKIKIKQEALCGWKGGGDKKILLSGGVVEERRDGRVVM